MSPSIDLHKRESVFPTTPRLLYICLVIALPQIELAKENIHVRSVLTIVTRDGIMAFIQPGYRIKSFMPSRPTGDGIQSIVNCIT